MTEPTSLLDLLTAQIVEGKIPVEEARAIILRREHYKRNPAVIRLNIKSLKLEAIKDALQRHKAVNEAAKELGISKSTLYRLKRKF